MARRPFLLFPALLALPASAEHLPGGTINVRCIGGNQHEVTLKVWRECTGAPMIDQAITFANSCGVSFSVSSMPLVGVENVSPVCAGEQGQTTCDGGAQVGIEEYTYRLTVFLSPCNYWRIYWHTCCRYPALNLQWSEGLYIEALLNNSGGACNTLPAFSDGTPPFVCVDQPVSYDPGAIVPPGLQARYRLIDARKLTDISDPFNVVAVPVAYHPPFTGAEPYTGLSIDSLSGQITFTPLAQGYIVVSMAIDLRDGNGVWRGTVMRDFPFISIACDNNVPPASSGQAGGATGSATVTGPYTLAACGGPACFVAAFEDLDTGQSLELSSNVAAVLPGASFTVSGANPAVATVCWNSDLAPLGTFSFTITVLDDACPVRGQQVYTYSISIEPATADAGADATIPLCPGATINLADHVTGDPGGTWSEGPEVSAPGDYTYTVEGPCGQDEAVFTVVAQAAPDAGQGAMLAICPGGTVDLSGFVTGDGGGDWWPTGPVASAPGTYAYTVTNACGSDQAVFIVSESPSPNAGEDYSALVCPQSDAFALIDSLQGAPDPGGAWFYDGEPVSGIFNPAVDSAGEYCYVVAHPQCGSDTACVRINFADGTDPDCITLQAREAAIAAPVHPNPTTGQLFLSAPAPLKAEALDAAGRVVWSARVGPGASAFTLPEALRNGSYILRLSGSDGTMTMSRFELLR
ncbi:MAG: T9SS type A sorting domain-containing protein [Flavobacteriales bacterium]